MSKTAAEKAAEAEAKASAEARTDAEPLAERLAEAQEKGYHGKDAADLSDSEGDGINDAKAVDLTSPQYGGVQLEGTTAKTPGGHPGDPTVASAVGAAASK